MSSADISLRLVPLTRLWFLMYNNVPKPHRWLLLFPYYKFTFTNCVKPFLAQRTLWMLHCTIKGSDY